MWINVLKIFGVVLLGLFVLSAMVAVVAHDDAASIAAINEPARPGRIESAIDAAINTIDPPPVVTLGEYLRIKDGMTYEQVRGIIGEDGVENSRVSLGGSTTVMYSWMNRGGANMNAMFQEGRLITKAQFGLR